MWKRTWMLVLLALFASCNGNLPGGGGSGGGGVGGGLTWTLRNSGMGTDTKLSGVTHGNGTYVAVGVIVGGGVLTSQDASSWDLHTVDTARSGLLKVTYGQGTFVAVGPYLVLTSTDGAQWSVRHTDLNETYMDAAYGNGRFVVVGYSGSIYTFGDGAGWQQVRTGGRGVMDALMSVVYDGSRFVAVGAGGDVLLSPDGLDWTDKGNVGTPDPLMDVAYGNGLYVAISDTNKIYTSSDGRNWTVVYDNVAWDFFAVAYGDGRFVVSGSYGNVLVSEDGSNWSSGGDTKTKQPLRDIAYGGGRFVAVGDDGVIVTSP